LKHFSGQNFSEKSKEKHAENLGQLLEVSEIILTFAAESFLKEKTKKLSSQRFINFKNTYFL
jgi:hypothetical protein